MRLPACALQLTSLLGLLAEMDRLDSLLFCCLQARRRAPTSEAPCE